MDQVHAVGGAVEQSQERDDKAEVVTLKPKMASPYVVLLTRGKPPHSVVEAIMEQGYVITAESCYGNDYTTQFKRADATG